MLRDEITGLDGTNSVVDPWHLVRIRIRISHYWIQVLLFSSVADKMLFHQQ